MENDQWITTSWGNLVELKYGKSLKGYRDATGEVQVFGTNGPVGWCDQPLCDFPSVIVGRKGAYRGIHYSDRPFYVIDTAFFIVPKMGINLKWAYYSLLTQDINGMDSGSAIPSTSREDFYALQAHVPPRSVQDLIVEHLDALNEKIELNRQINATLESMAQGLFKSWFVDFDPSIDNALKAGNPIPEPLQTRAERRKALGEQRKSLPEHIQSQFPSSFVFSEEMGWVPEGWEPIPLAKAICINPKVTLKKGEVAKFIDMKALPTSGYSVGEVFEKEYSGGAKFENGDVLLARITPCLENGKTGLVDFLDEGEPGFGSTEFIVLRGTGKMRTPFIASLARDEVFRQHCITSMVGSSGRQRVQNSCFESYFVAFPDAEDILDKYDKACSGFFDKMTLLKEESQALANLRDVLLPKLLSGQLRIPDAEQQLAEAI
jgi:type I restriction enzyme, S subunit